MNNRDWTNLALLVALVVAGWFAGANTRGFNPAQDCYVEQCSAR